MISVGRHMRLKVFVKERGPTTSDVLSVSPNIRSPVRQTPNGTRSKTDTKE